MSRIHLPWLMLTMLTICLAQTAGGAEAVCQRHGTSVDFYGTPAEAAQEAALQEKLVFVLHVSGLFEDAAFT